MVTLPNIRSPTKNSGRCSSSKAGWVSGIKSHSLLITRAVSIERKYVLVIKCVGRCRFRNLAMLMAWIIPSSLRVVCGCWCLKASFPSVRPCRTKYTSIKFIQQSVRDRSRFVATRCWFRYHVLVLWYQYCASAWFERDGAKYRSSNSFQLGL